MPSGRWWPHREEVGLPGNPHNFHVHGVQFKIAAHAASAPPPHLAGWKDTVFIPPDATTDLLLRFIRHTDPAVPYMFHCAAHSSSRLVIAQNALSALNCMLSPHCL
jgi:Multicopper oxidase